MMPAIRRDHQVDPALESLHPHLQWAYLSISQIKSNQTDYFIVRLKVDQKAGQLSLPHLGITKTEKIELKHKTDEQISQSNQNF